MLVVLGEDDGKSEGGGGNDGELTMRRGMWD